ncbi:Protein NRT1/ PTR FAMILY 5.5 like [Actinidia chinensis var. chinensis]|uniref:Protein NRT1/ PTR FAMILY 5.5 like n=1 Tax=Actinidia chinensis var. chinensis TaxID=1590841 RepID=A0A2R6QKC3_ACTCC|nr:Protein NRT1/ PTR FAMILY 5.5 like [Actinidia chinensis var. chinensis]
MQYIVDTFMGNYWMLIISSFAYSTGLGFLTMSTPHFLAKATDTCSPYESQCIGQIQQILFYTALVLIAVGLFGHLISLGTFMAEQLVEEVLENFTSRSRVTRFVGSCMAILIPIGGVLAIWNANLWSIRFGIAAICTVLATILFLSGSCLYNCVSPQGSSLTTAFGVLVAATSKLFPKRPKDANLLYQKRDPDLFFLPHSRRLRCLEKAAIILPTQPQDEQENKRWKLCTVTEVENTKLSLSLIPFCATLIFCGVVSSIGNTYFIEQVNFHRASEPLEAQCRPLIDPHSDASLYAPTIGIGVWMTFAILCCVTASKMEIRRLNVVESHSLIDQPDRRIPMSIFWLLPQFILLGAVDGILESSICALLTDQVRPSMVKYAIHFARGVIGLGNIGGVLSVHEVGRGLGFLSMSTPPVFSNSTGTFGAYRPECIVQLVRQAVIVLATEPQERAREMPVETLQMLISKTESTKLKLFFTDVSFAKPKSSRNSSIDKFPLFPKTIRERSNFHIVFSFAYYGKRRDANLLPLSHKMSLTYIQSKLIQNIEFVEKGRR